MQLLIVPVALAVIGFLFTFVQQNVQYQIETARIDEARRVEDMRAQAAQKIEEQRAQDAALEAYLDQMSELILDKDLRNLEGENTYNARTLARARTLAVLRRLGPDRKGSVVRFLYESALLGTKLSDDISQAEGPTRPAIVDLDQADLSDAALRQAFLPQSALGFADLSGANLIFATLIDADLAGTILEGANLSGADLSSANLGSADLTNANLSFAKLEDTYLTTVYLSNANLIGAKGVTEKKLEKQAASLRNTIMPDGTIYPPGRYAARMFEPAVSFEAGEGWELGALETTEYINIQTGPKGGHQLLFTNPRHVFDPTNLSEPKELPAPENTEEWVSWLQNHPNLDTSKPLPVSVGGASGKRIDVRASSMPENYPRKVCGEQPCVPLYPSGESENASFEGWKDRYVIVDVEGETVLIDVAAPADKFNEFLPKVQKVLDSVEWQGG